jgi:hypothetical protein
MLACDIPADLLRKAKENMAQWGSMDPELREVFEAVWAHDKRATVFLQHTGRWAIAQAPPSNRDESIVFKVCDGYEPPHDRECPLDLPDHMVAFRVKLDKDAAVYKIDDETAPEWLYGDPLHLCMSRPGFYFVIDKDGDEIDIGVPGSDARSDGWEAPPVPTHAVFFHERLAEMVDEEEDE